MRPRRVIPGLDHKGTAGSLFQCRHGAGKVRLARCDHGKASIADEDVYHWKEVIVAGSDSLEVSQNRHSGLACDPRCPRGRVRVLGVGIEESPGCDEVGSDFVGLYGDAAAPPPDDGSLPSLAVDENEGPLCEGVVADENAFDIDLLVAESLHVGSPLVVVANPADVPGAAAEAGDRNHRSRGPAPSVTGVVCKRDLLAGQRVVGYRDDLVEGVASKSDHVERPVLREERGKRIRISRPSARCWRKPVPPPP